MSDRNVPLFSRSFLVTAVVCGLALLLLRAALRPEYGRRNVRVFTEMTESLARESLSTSAFLPGGITQQALPAGVVLHGQLPFGFGPGPEEAQRAGRELMSPFADDETAARARGAELFGTFCVVCHGADGGGRGPVVMRGLLPPPSLLAARSRTIADGEIFHILTRGQGNMASYAAQLTSNERWQVIAYIRSMQEQS